MMNTKQLLKKLPKLVACLAILFHVSVAVAQKDTLYYDKDSCYRVRITVYDDHAEIIDFYFAKEGSGMTAYLPVNIDGTPVTKIGDRAVADLQAYNPTYVIPSTVEEIGNRAFESVYPLTIIFEQNSSLKKIGEYAFAGSRSAGSSYRGPNSIVLPESVEDIGQYCFSASNLKSLTLPSSLKTIPKGMCYGCSKLTDCKLPLSLEDIGDEAFYGCKIYKPVLPSSLKKIGDLAFSLTGISSITIPESVTNIGKDAFRDCEYLKTVVLSSGLKSISGGLFYNCKVLSKINIPESVTSIGSYAFYNCEKLPSVTLPQGLTAITNNAFSGCKSFTTMTIPDHVTSIGSYAFEKCGMTDISMPDGITSIGDGALRWNSFETIDLPDSLRTIGATALLGSGLRYLVIPPYVTSIGEDAFSGLDFIIMEPEHYVSLEEISYGTLAKKIYVPFSTKADYDAVTKEMADEGIIAYDPKAEKTIAANQYYTFRNRFTGQYLQLSANGEAETALVDEADMRCSAGAQVRLVESGTANKYYLSIQNVPDPMLGTLNFKGTDAVIDHPALRQWNLMVDGLYMAVDDKGNFVKTDVANDNADWYIMQSTEFDVKMKNGNDGKSYAALYLPFDVQSTGNSHLFVATTTDDHSVTMSEVNEGKLRNSQGALLVAYDGAETVTLQIASRAQAPVTNLFTGSCKDMFSVSAQDEYLGLDYTASDGIGFYSIETPVLKANTAYLSRSSVNGNATFLEIILPNTISGISSVVIDEQIKANGLMFDMQGRRIYQKPQKGVYIMNGRKYIRK